MKNLKPDNYYIYEYKKTKILTKTFKHPRYNKLWASDVLVLTGKENKAMDFEFEKILDKGIIKIIETVGTLKTLKNKFPELILI